jgi:hypothetical protein
LLMDVGCTGSDTRSWVWPDCAQWPLGTIRSAMRTAARTPWKPTPAQAQTSIMPTRRPAAVNAPGSGAPPDEAVDGKDADAPSDHRWPRWSGPWVIPRPGRGQEPVKGRKRALRCERRSRQTPVRPAWIVLDFLEHMRYQLSPQISLGKLLLQTS